MELTDPYALKAEGLKHIQEYAGNVWTDHNLHDPGIIILEQLCYALADLNYRTSFDMADLLERPEETDSQPLFSSRDVLHSNPVSATDFRKLILDVKGVRNAWIVHGSDPHPVYYSMFRDELEYDPWKHSDHLPEDQLKVKGIMDVLVAFDFDENGNDLNSNRLVWEVNPYELLVVEFPRWDDKDMDWDELDLIWEDVTSLKWYQGESVFHYHEMFAEQREKAAEYVREIMIPRYLENVRKAHEIRDEIYQLVQNHRNFCQDFGQIRAIKTEYVGLSANIEVESDANAEELLATLLFQLDHHLSPGARFYDLNELKEKGIPSEEIFNGPALKHGFLLDEELPKQLTNLRTSDLVNTIMDLPGIKAIKNFHAASYPGGVKFRSAQRWCVTLNGDRNYMPRVAPEFVHVKFYVDGMRISIRWEEVLKRIKQKQANSSSLSYPINLQIDNDPPAGNFRELDSYYSIQRDFPRNFEIGEDGLPAEASISRQAQALQLKSYLLVFEQLMGNYAKQLSSIPELFSLNPESNQTLFSQYLHDVPEVDQLLTRVHGAEDLPKAIAETKEIINELLETREQFLSRKNRILNHLMGRFGEDIDQNALLRYRNHEDDGGDEVTNKLLFLKNYPIVSARRGNGFDYAANLSQSSINLVGGLQERIYRLAGIRNLSTRKLADKNENEAEGFHMLEHVLIRPQVNDVVDGTLVRDSFLPLFEDISDHWTFDPYSSVASVIIPNWPLRFQEQEFRDYLEKLIHMQAPAHIQMVVHWVDRTQMRQFENALFTWAKALAAKHSNLPEYVERANKLIREMGKLYEEKEIIEPHINVPAKSISFEGHTTWKIMDYTNRSKFAGIGHMMIGNNLVVQQDKSDWRIVNENIIPGVGYMDVEEDFLVQKSKKDQEGSIGQFIYSGNDRMSTEGMGTMLINDLPVGNDIEVVKFSYKMGTHPNAEAGLVFDWIDNQNYKVFYYSNRFRKMMVSQNKDGTHVRMLGTPVEGLSGTTIDLRLMMHRGKLRCIQTSPDAIGSEFLLKDVQSVGGMKLGLYTRYCNDANFEKLELVGSDSIEKRIPIKIFPAHGKPTQQMN